MSEQEPIDPSLTAPQINGSNENSLQKLLKLRSKVKEILQAEDPCWLDWGRLYSELAELCNMKDYKPKLLSEEEMLESCRRFIESLSSSKEYIPKTTELTMRLFNRISEVHIEIAKKLNWDMYIDPNDVEWRLALAEALDDILKESG